MSKFICKVWSFFCKALNVINGKMISDEIILVVKFEVRSYCNVIRDDKIRFCFAFITVIKSDLQCLFKLKLKFYGNRV